MRARTSDVSSSSCLVAVGIVVRLDAMKSASRPGVGDVRRERRQVVGQHRRQLHDLLEVRADVALQRVDFERVGVADDFRRLA